MQDGTRREARRHFTYSNMMSTLSVFLVIAGGSAIAASIPKNSVKSKSVKDNALRGKDIRDDSLTGADVKESQLDLALPASLPPSGPAGGSLTGQYPNPTLGENTVGATQLRDDAVTSPKLADDAVNTPELADNSVTTNEVAPLTLNSSDVAPNSLSGLSLAPDSVSADELEALGDDDSNSINIPDTTPESDGDMGTASVTATCDPGEQIITGSTRWVNRTTAPTDDELFISELRINLAANSVTAFGSQDTGTFRILELTAICLSP